MKWVYKDPCQRFCSTSSSRTMAKVLAILWLLSLIFACSSGEEGIQLSALLNLISTLQIVGGRKRSAEQLLTRVMRNDFLIRALRAATPPGGVSVSLFVLY